jgi:hypothetical protein
MESFRNGTFIFANESLSQISGRCFTFNDRTEYKGKESSSLIFKRGQDVRIYLHGRGAEFWIPGKNTNT